MIRALRYTCLFSFALLLSGCGTFSHSLKDVLNDSRIDPVTPNDPVARLKLKQRLVKIGQQVAFDASASASLQQQTLSYRWFLIEKPANSLASLSARNQVTNSLTIDQPGRYRVRLVVNDGEFDSVPYDTLLSTDANDLDRVRFVALGDAGTGDDLQKYVANAMAKVCAARGCDFAVSAGDNIYKKGPNSVDDEQFYTKFEKPYAALDMPMFMVLGNHDNTGLMAGDGGFNARGMIEVDYHHKSDKWTMPQRYYRVTAPLQGQRVRDNPAQNQQPLVELFALDSTPLTSAPDMLPEYRIKAYGSHQADWIKAGVHNSRAQWKIALAHHPYISNGYHGNAGDYDRLITKYERYSAIIPGWLKKLKSRIAGTHFKRFFEDNLCNQLDLYISGHDHNLQWLKAREQCGKTEFIVSGAGAKFKKCKQSPCEQDVNPRNPVRWVENEKLGFFWVEIIANRMRIALYTVDLSGESYHNAYEQSITHAGY